MDYIIYNCSMNNKLFISKILKGLRLALGYSITDFAKLVGVSKQSWSDLELGKYGMTVRIQKLLENALEEIFNGRL